VLKAQGFTVGEIAATLSMTHDAVKERLRRARKGGAAEK
jgi:DNA-directed RNA polymerase specialized sigma24 family protein